MKKYYIYILFIILSFITCSKEEYNEIKSDCDCEYDSSYHPKSVDYQELLEKYVKEGIPGISFYVNHPEEGIWAGAAGKARIEDNTALTPCHVFASASLAKPYTATAIMMLVEQGKINLDYKIENYLDKELCKKIANTNKATVWHLMNHTSGIKECTSQWEFTRAIIHETICEMSPERILSFIYNKPANFEPGKKFSYSDTNYQLLALIIENVTGNDHYTFFKDNIFTPLNLNNTYYDYNIKQLKPFATVNYYYCRRYDKLLENHTDIQVCHTDNQIGFAGIYATAKDYGEFMHALFNNQLISKESLNEMENWVNPRSSYIYGLGLRLVETKYGICIGHNGTGHASQTFAYHFPESGITVAGCANIIGGPYYNKFREDFWNEIIEQTFK
jgi:D-alanyl-D-alanine carboxypeptidase